MKKHLLCAALALALSACATEQVSPEKKWNVKVSQSGEPKVWVTKPDGSMQCEKGSAVLTPEKAASDLKKAGVMVYDARTGHDGLMHTAVCGSSTGNTVEAEIGRSDLPKALKLGFATPKTSKN